jgi:hypothetical protein
MATTITWYGGDGANQILPANSGDNDTLGFFGSNFGFSIRVGEYNNTNYVTNDNGTTNYGQCPNLRYYNTSGAYVSSELTPTELLNVDQTEATLRIRLTTDSAVRTQNTSFRAFDRISINNNPSGVTVYAAEIRKHSVSIRGSGDTNWTQIYGSGSTLSLDSRILETASTTQNFYVGLTVSPTSIGEKTNLGFYFETEFI